MAIFKSMYIEIANNTQLKLVYNLFIKNKIGFDTNSRDKKLLQVWCNIKALSGVCLADNSIYWSDGDAKNYATIVKFKDFMRRPKYYVNHRKSSVSL